MHNATLPAWPATECPDQQQLLQSQDNGHFCVYARDAHGSQIRYGHDHIRHRCTFRILQY